MIHWWQIGLVTLYACYQILDEITLVSSAGSPVFAGAITGLIMGDLATGLFIGGSMQLVVLGVGTFGGASRIDANSGVVLATVFAISQGMSPELALTSIAVPVAALMVYTDILGRMTNVYLVHRIDKNIQNFEYRKIGINYLLGAVPWALSRGIVVFLALVFGGPLVSSFVEAIQTGFLKIIADGLTVAGGVLPALGFAILLRYLPTRRHIAYLLLGFALTALYQTLFSNISVLGRAVNGLLPEPLAHSFNSVPMLALATIGFALAFLAYQRDIAHHHDPVARASSDSNHGEIDDDEL